MPEFSEAMSKRRRETVYLSQLDGLQILWPGDVRALAEFVLRSFQARDRIVSTGPSSSRVKSAPTLHGLAGHFAGIAGIPEVRIERQFEEHGLSLDATVEFDPPPAARPSEESDHAKE
jgi:hypothetical protein